MGFKNIKLAILVVSGLVLSACNMSVSVEDLDKPSDAPAAPALDPHVKLSPGRVESTSTTFGLKANITPTDQVLTGSSLRAKVSIQRRFR